uniref:MICOS complex subunit MIC19 n=1 Tax=Nannospalax galili TaxID=1026970 RepID=A0A8C6QT14_NANGA
MGGTASTRWVTFEADEHENITVVKGIRLSENVIDRMKESCASGSKSQRVCGASVSDEELKRRVAEALASEQAKKEPEGQRRLKQARDLEWERAAADEQLTRAVLRERISSEERPKAKQLASQLEEKDQAIKKQGASYKEQLARLEERRSEFYQVTTEEYQEAAQEVEYHPVCADLQAKILQCCRQNTHCSALASQYMHCVNHAKQSTLGKGG